MYPGYHGSIPMARCEARAIALTKKVAKYFPEKPQEWDEVTKMFSKTFSSDHKQVKERGCREKMDRILVKYTKLYSF